MPRPPRLAFLWRIVIGGGLVLLVAASPPLRTAVTSLEPSAPAVLFLLAAAGAALGAWSRWRGRPASKRRVRAAERRLGSWLRHWGWVGMLLLAIAPLWSHWEMRPPDPTTAFSAQLGFIPWKDARRHLEGGLRLLDEGVMGAFSERRPLNAPWLAARLALAGGNVQWALVSQAMVFALALCLVAAVVGRRYGPWSALALVGLVHALTRAYLPTFNTEPLGVTLACLGAALLLSRSAPRRLAVLAAGLFLLGMALGARPGPQFLLPALAVWGVFMHRTRWRAAIVVLALAVLAAGLSPLAINALYGSGEGSFSSYPAYTFYGLTTGGNFRQVRADFGDEMATSGDEREVARVLWGEAFANLRVHPRVFLSTLASNQAKFLGKLPDNVVPLADLGPLFRRHPLDAEAPAAGAPPWTTILARVAILAAALGFVIRILRGRDPAALPLWTAIVAGVLLSVPFVYGDAGFRGLAAGYPLLAAALALGLASRDREWPTRASAGERGLIRAAVALAAVLIIVSLVGPAAARPRWARPPRDALARLAPGQDMVVALETTPRVLISRKPPSAGDVPSLQRRSFEALLAYGGFVDDAHVDQLPPPFVMASAYDFVTRQQYVLIGPESLARDSTGFVRLGVRPLGTGGKIYQADTWERLP